MFGRRERRMKEKKIEVKENKEKKMFFLDLVWYARSKKNKELVELQLSNFKYIILF